MRNRTTNIINIQYWHLKEDKKTMGKAQEINIDPPTYYLLFYTLQEFGPWLYLPVSNIDLMEEVEVEGEGEKGGE